MKHTLFIISISIVFISCGGNSTSTPEIDMNINDCSVKKINFIGNIKFKTMQNNKDEYIVFTNTTNKKYNFNLISNGLNKNLDLYKEKKNLLKKEESLKNKIMNFNHKVPIVKKNKINKSTYLKTDDIGNNEIFYLEKDLSSSTRATLKKIVKNITTKYGEKTLNIWVSNDSFGKECIKTYCIKDEMIDDLVNNFLKRGEDNDIYDWVSNIFGEEWGKTTNSALIDNNDEITILLTDINNDNSVIGGTLGYFYAKDNYKKSIYKGSNEKVMFYIDSVLFASYYGKDEWNIENYQQKKVLSTLAHELEHMIHFYQKNVLQRNSGLDSWIDEMLAVSTEDIVATKLKTKGLREVSYLRGDAGDDYNQYGKFPIFNKNINQTLSKWNGKKEDYAMVSSFGSYLIRNYGGAQLLHDILYNRYTDERAIVYATNKSANGKDKDFNTLIQDWGIAVLLSSRTDLDVDGGYLYNLGDFLETEYNGINYSLGSIDFFNYYERPKIVTSLNSIEPKSNLYYKIPKDINQTINIKIDKNIKVAFVKK
jgi:hypothetical protein